MAKRLGPLGGSMAPRQRGPTWGQVGVMLGVKRVPAEAPPRRSVAVLGVTLGVARSIAKNRSQRHDYLPLDPWAEVS